MDFIVHTLSYHGPVLTSALSPRTYQPEDYAIYAARYNAAFRPMRLALGLSPDCCASPEELASLRDHVYILEQNGQFVGSVSLFDNEIDGLIIDPAFRRQGWGERLLRFAVAALQKQNLLPVLHVADWNQGALNLYLRNHFVITQSEWIRK